MPLRNMNINAQEILNDLPGGFFLYRNNDEEKMVYANNEAIRIFGCGTLEEFMEFVHYSFRGVVHPDDLDRVEAEIIQQIRSSPSLLDTVEYRITRKDGQVRWIEDFGHLIRSEKWGEVYYVFISDITDRKLKEIEAAANAKKMALQLDPLTGLYEKHHFYKQADAYLKEHPEEACTILAFDIENFGYINETYGIQRGDDILRGVASINQSDIPGYIMGARIDGDRFVYLFRRQALSYQKLQDHIDGVCQEFHIPDLSVKFGQYNIEDPSPVQTMCSRAQLALDSIKGAYGKQFAVYDDSLWKDWIRRQQIAAASDKSLRNHHFVVYYQPKYDLTNKRIGGAEALIRWIHPEYGFMNPGLFIPLFENNGFISKLDLYVLEEVCGALKRWRSEGREPVPISINLSRRDLDSPGFAAKLITTVDSYEIHHDLIHFEITESCITRNPTQSAESLQLLHNAGFSIELDDFGSGYSSMVALNSLPIDILKIDMSIIQQDIPNSERNILEFIMQLAKMMKLKTVQEGVETEAQLRRVQELGCNYVQGFYFSKPVPIDQFEHLLDSQK